MFCPKCGTFLQDDAQMCNQCGQEIRPAAAGPDVLQPGYSATRPYVPNYLVFAILVTIFCCLPTGIAAIVYASQVNTKVQLGDIAGAQLASKNAQMWCWVSLGAGVLVGLAYFLFFMLGITGHWR